MLLCVTYSILLACHRLVSCVILLCVTYSILLACHKLLNCVILFMCYL